MFISTLITLASITCTTAHGGVLYYNIGGTIHKGFSPYNTPTGQATIQRQWETYEPITSTTDSFLACNDPGTVVSPQLTATVAAGSTFTAYWNPSWPHIVGPVMVYMADCDGDCTDADPSDLDWFKINEAGLISGTIGNGQWGMGELVEDDNSWTSTLPEDLPNGNYMIRHELLALHNSYQPEFYPECAQLTITDGGIGTPGPTVKFPGGYSATDPSIDIDIYSDANQINSDYDIPGPPVWPDWS